MERDPNQLYNFTGEQDLSVKEPQSPESLLPAYEQVNKAKQESLTSSKSFEELVHDALAEELKFERDPALRDQANQRADEILADFQKAKQMQAGGALPTFTEDEPKNEEQDLAKRPDSNQEKTPKPDRLPNPGTGLNFGLPDLIMAFVIAILLVIIILLLIF